ncbi:MAG: Gfo/Idh/MocA family oxidoreductase [Terriglobia bacterium]
MDSSSQVSRRGFIKAAGLGGATLAAAPAWGRILGANDRINVALIGVGCRGNDHLELLLQHRKNKPDIEIVAICDTYQKRLSMALRKAPGAKTYAHHQEVLQRTDIDAVFIATPDHWHAPITLAAMESGKDVYVEKPMTHTVEESKVVAHRAKELKRVVQVGVQGTSWTRWHKIHDIIQSGMIGQVVAVQGTYSRNAPDGDWNTGEWWSIDPAASSDATGDNHIDWKQWLGPAPQMPFVADRFFRFRKYWDYSGGIATDLHYHVVAPFHVAVANDFPLRVTGMGGLWIYNDGRQVPDTFLTAADYPSKYSMTVQSSQVNENGPTMMIRGTKATIHLSDEWEGPPSRQYDYADIFPESTFLDEFIKKNGNDQVRIDGVGNEGDLKHVDNFLDCVRSRQQPNCHVDIGYKVSIATDLSVRSYRNGKVYYFDAEREQVVEKA